MVSHRVMSLIELLTPPAGACGCGIADVVRLVPVVDVDVPDGTVGSGHVLVEPRTGRRHPERLVQHVLAEVLPRLARAHRDRLGPGGQPEVGVGVRDPERVERIVTQLVQDVAPVVAEVLQQVAGVIGQSGPVRVHVADRDHLRHDGVGQCEPRQLLDDRRVPADRVLAPPGGRRRWRPTASTATPAGRPCRGRSCWRVGRVPVANVLDPEALCVHGPCRRAPPRPPCRAGPTSSSGRRRGRRAWRRRSRRRSPATALPEPDGGGTSECGGDRFARRLEAALAGVRSTTRQQQRGRGDDEQRTQPHQRFHTSTLAGHDLHHGANVANVAAPRFDALAWLGRRHADAFVFGGGRASAPPVRTTDAARAGTSPSGSVPAGPRR